MIPCPSLLGTTMRTCFLIMVSVTLLAASALLRATPQEESVKVRLRLIDATTGKAVGGIVRILSEKAGKPLALPGLYDRSRGLDRSAAEAGWHVVPATGAETTLPRGTLRAEAVSGLETAHAQETIDLRKDAPKEIALKVQYLFRPEEQQLVAGNTHLHLRGKVLEEADEYLRQIPAADGLKVLFISYLERDKDDATYITNRYPVGDLKQFDATGVLINNGEEHRHNFKAYGQGYGHVMFLDIKELVKPVSIGSGITGAGFDEPALRDGIDAAHKQGGTVIWCHNTNGYEDVVSALAGRLHALNVFDGSRTGSFEENYYRYLNLGIRLPISTGTDWFMYDFSRVYAKVPGKLTIKSWLEAVKAGRCVATNGPLLSLKVDGREVGDVIDLDKPKTVRIEASGLGRHDLQQLQLILNGKVVKTQPATKEGNHFAARFTHELRIDQPAWLALRIDSKAKNEFDKQLFAHTSPIYVDFAGRRVFDIESATALLRQLEEGHAAIKTQGSFSSPKTGQRVLSLYDESAKELTSQINKRK
jgi:hypothetical protein